MMKLLLVALSAVTLAGCQTKQLSELNYSETKALASEIVQRCVAQGVKPESPEMRLCTQQEVNREHATRQGNMARLQRSAAAMSAGLNNASQGYYRAASQSYGSRSVTCRRNPSPVGYTSMSCY